MTDPLIGRDIEGRYKILEKIGGGGMGVVYRAHHALLNVDVALKVIRPNFAETPEARERFLREAKTATALSHPNIVAVREVGQFEGKLYLTMDLVAGRTLQDVLTNERRMSSTRAIGIIAQVLEALEAAHAKGIVHRDLKPGNIMVEEGDGVRVLDFGLAKWVGDSGSKDQVSSLTGSGMAVGTVLYMAPEQVAGDPVDGRTDLYAVSVMFYQMLSGALPHAAESNQQLLRKILLEPPKPLSAAGINAPTLEPVILRGLAKEPKDRPANATEYKRLLEGAGGLSATAMRATPTLERPAAGREVVVAAKPSKRMPVAAIAAVLVLLGAGGVFGWRYWQSQKYERHVRDGRAAVDDRRWDDAIKAFEAAAKIEDSAEAASGLKRARFESKKELTKKARTLDDEVKAWEEAAKFGDVEEELRGAKVRRGFRAAEEALDGGDTLGAALALSPIDALVTGKDEKQEYGALSKRLEEMEAAEKAARKVVDEAIATKDIFIERAAWEDYVKSFPKAARAIAGKARLLLIETELKTGPGLFVDVTPRGAAVYVDGKKAGTTPVLLRDLPAGKHSILISAEAHDTLERDIELTAGGRIDIKETLPPLTGSLTVTTNAPGADIYVEGPQSQHAKVNEAGEAKFAALLIGNYTVRAVAKGFDEAKQEAVIKSKQAIQVTMNAREHEGTLIVKTVPAGLDVIVGDAAPKKSPIRLEGHAAGPVEVRVRSEDGMEHLVLARVRGDAEETVEVDVAASIALQRKAYAGLVERVKSGPPAAGITACDEFLKAVPGAPATTEVLLVKRALEVLSKQVIVAAKFDVGVPEGWLKAGYAMHLSPNGRSLIGLAAYMTEIHACDLESGRSWELTPRKANTDSLSWSLTGHYLYSRNKGDFMVWDVVLGKTARCRLETSDEEPELRWATDDAFILAWIRREGKPDMIRRYNVSTGEAEWTLENYRLSIEGDLSTRYTIIHGDVDIDPGQSYVYQLLDLTNGKSSVIEGAVQEGYPKLRCTSRGAKRAALAADPDYKTTQFTIVDLESGGKIASFGHAFGIGGAWFSTDGSVLWHDVEREKTVLGVSIKDTSKVFRVPYGVEYATVGEWNGFGVIGKTKDGGWHAPLESLSVFDQDTGDTVVDVKGPWSGDLLSRWRLKDEIQPEGEPEVVVFSEKADPWRVFVFDRVLKRVLFDGPINKRAKKVRAIRSHRVLYSWDDQRSDPIGVLHADGKSDPYWEGPGLADVVEDRGLALVGRGVHMPPYPPQGKIGWFDLRTMSTVLVDRAFRISTQSMEPVRFGEHLLLMGKDGHARVYREKDLIDALLPWKGYRPLRPGELSAVAEAVIREQEGK